MSRIRSRMSWLLLLLPLMLQPFAAQETIDKIVAIVDDEIILESEVFQYLQFNLGSQVNLESMPSSTVDSLRRQILDDLIDQKLLLTKARQDTIQVQQREVDSELDTRVQNLIRQIGGEEKLEEYYGMPLAKIKRQFRPMVEEGLMIERLRAQQMQRVKVSRNEVMEFWKVYQDSIPELRDAMRVAHILLQDNLSDASIAAAVARADSAREQIINGDTAFEEYAREYSDDPGSASNGGNLGTTSRGDLVPEFEAAAFNLEEGEISEPVVSPFGVHVIRLNSRTGEKINTSHILFNVVPAMEDQQTTMARADSIAEAVRGGRDFTTLAREYSIDSKTAALGGDLGWFSPEELPENFRAPLESLKADEVADPFRTNFGVHVAMVTDRVYSRPISLEEDYNRIENMARAQKQETEYEQWLVGLAQETYIERK